MTSDAYSKILTRLGPMYHITLVVCAEKLRNAAVCITDNSTARIWSAQHQRQVFARLSMQHIWSAFAGCCPTSELFHNGIGQQFIARVQLCLHLTMHVDVKVDTPFHKYFTYSCRNIVGCFGEEDRGSQSGVQPIEISLHSWEQLGTFVQTLRFSYPV